MFPEDVYVVYNTGFADIETVHPYKDLAFNSLRRFCAKDGLDPKEQTKYQVIKLSEALPVYTKTNAQFFFDM